MIDGLQLAAFPPGMILILGGLLLLLTSGVVRSALLLGLPAVTLFWIWQTVDASVQVEYLGYMLSPYKSDALSRLFGTVFAVMAGVGGLFALNQANSRELAAAFIYAGSAIGVVFSGDLITLFVFWEMMAIFSTMVIWNGGLSARGPGFRYALIHFMGGVLLMAGIAGHVAATGSVEFSAIKLESWGSGWPGYLMLAGILINAGAVPMSSWLPDSYPAASWSGTVFLSAFTTKTAVYTLIRGFPGHEILIWIGLAMVFYGIIWAILENDMRRILAYSIINQVGFMVTAVGIGSDLALNGAAAHAFAHIIYKALLLMSAGSVLYLTGKSKCTDLGGLFRTMPVSCICGIIGALAISAFPFTSGFPAKSLISESAAQAKLAIVWFSLAAASAGVFLHAGIKFPWFVFFQKDSGMRPDEKSKLPWNMKLAMILFSVACIWLGVMPNVLYDLLPYPVSYVPYTGAHVVYQLQLLLFSGLAFFILLDFLKRTTTITLDFDWLYRVFGKTFAIGLNTMLATVWQRFTGGVLLGGQRAFERLYRVHGPDGVLGRSWPTGNMTFWTTIVLAASLLVYIL